VSSLVDLENKDIFQASLAGGTVIVVYLFREVSGCLLPSVASLSAKVETHQVTPEIISNFAFRPG